MTDQFLGEIRIFAGSSAPTGWALCHGQLMPLSQNTALFAVLGTFYGGDGVSSFRLPNLQGCAPMHQGQGPGLSDRSLGESSGSEAVTLLASQVPAHSHNLVGDGNDGNSTNPQTGYIGTGNQLFAASADLGAMQAESLPVTGGNLPHSNMQPYLTLNFIIAITGDFPSPV